MLHHPIPNGPKEFSEVFVSTSNRGSALLTRIAVTGLLAIALAIPVQGTAQAQTPTLVTELLAGPEARDIGPAVMSGRIVDLAVVELDTRVFYLASATGGVWKTTNNGVTFTPIFQDEATHSVGDIAVHQRDTSVVWVGTGERASRQSSSWGDGVYRSTDGGETWTNVGLRDSYHIGRITLHPTDPDIAYVAAMGHLWGPNPERGLYKTTDGGESWEAILQIDEDTGVVDVAMDPSNPNLLYTATYQRRRRPYGFHGGGPGSGLYKSTDGGSTWTELTDSASGNGLPEGILGRIGISIYQSDPRIVYVSVEQGFRYNASTAYNERRAGLYRSEDRGETWEFMSDWNPRPMYASQPLVDPSDDQRIYMVNSYSWSDDGGRTWTVPNQSLHGDDRLVWVNPTDSRHVMKADDGGLGISYDRGQTWIYATHLPLSQFYRVAVDNQTPYNVYGGLQDNGSWAGPSQVYRSEGILNEDWVKWGGGDGFANVVDTTNNRFLYTESQYLGLSRVDLVTGLRKSIRPGDPEGAIGARRNWETWKDLEAEEQRLGNAMAPANWDGPFILSPHDPSTIYAGTNILWKSTDRGDSWTSLGDFTTGTDRRTLEIMGETPEELTLSLDDGIPYWPTLSAIAESPLEEGVLFAGTDDGLVHASRDGGSNWTVVSDSISNFPELAWINGLEPSRHELGRVYLTVNNYRNDDYGNYLYRSDDYGMSWTDITGDLPANRVLRTLREDLRNPDVLYLGTELGLFYTLDGGEHWIELRNGMPTVAVNDLVIHPRENDLVIATHGRGIWIIDNLNPFQELSPVITRSEAAVFSIEPSEQIRYRSERGHTGDMIYHGDNPPSGAIIDFWLRDADADAVVSIHDVVGREVARVPFMVQAGLNRVVWNQRYSEPGQQENRPPAGPLVPPGQYLARLTLDGQESFERAALVREDPRLEVDARTRRAWTQELLGLGELRSEARELAGQVGQAARRIEEGLNVPQATREKVTDLARETGELAGRIGRLYGQVSGWVGPLTGDDVSRKEFFTEILSTLQAEWAETESRIPGGGA